MIQTIIRFGFLALICAAIGCFSVTETKAQEMDKVVRQQIRFARGANSAVIKKRISPGTTHLYTLRAAEGQTMTVIISKGHEVSFTIFSPSDQILEGADTQKMWRGMLDESGTYLITVSGQATANYTLEVYIK